MSTAIVTGISSQDGAYLAELLLDKGYRVFGTHRRTSSIDFWRLDELGIRHHPNLHLVKHDVTDLSSTIRLIEQAEPTEIYNLAAQSFVGLSFDMPVATAEVTGMGALNLLEAVRTSGRTIRFYQASTSEMFGNVQTTPRDEATPFWPRSPYAVAKLFAHWTTVNYRETHGIFASSGILFNHESPLRGREFVTRKITDAAAKISLGQLDCLELGNIDAQRDWGFARDYVEGMWRMLQIDEPDTFVLATGRAKSVRDFVAMAFSAAGIDIVFEGQAEREIGVDASSGRTIMRINPDFYRPAEIDCVIGNPTKAKEKLGWEAGCTIEDLCVMMVQADLQRSESGAVS